ncbi:HSF-type DNA-binding-domain-containing protein [Pilobolus umbonatus]|nr:HSF-type DNA-binding-domain-containing protein [Pilobolus umbonatus]
MNHAHAMTVPSLSINTQPILSGSSVSSGSSLNSPLVSPVNSPYPAETWDQLQNQFTQQMTLQPPNNLSVLSSKAGNGNTFVHKLYNMVIDKQYQHLISWTYTGTSFIVCNITEFSRDVLPKHFKHNNFSSFVRQLNMQVNKSPRGHRTLAENQIWEFSHPKFLKCRSDLLDDIKRKALEAESSKRETNNINSYVSMMQLSQSDMMQQISHLQYNFNQIVKELHETKKRQELQQQMIKGIMHYMKEEYGKEFSMPDILTGESVKEENMDRPPPIYITSADVMQSHHDNHKHEEHKQMQPPSPHQQQQHQLQHQDHLNGFFLDINQQPQSIDPHFLPLSPHSPSPRNSMSNPSLSPQSQQLNVHQYHNNRHPSFSRAYASGSNTPLPSSPCSTSSPFLHDNDCSSYSPRSPLSPNGYMLNTEQNHPQLHPQYHTFNT